MNLSEIPVHTIGMFGQGVKNLWMEDLNGLLDKHPVLEYPHKSTYFSLFLIEDAHGEVYIDNHKVVIDQPKAIVIKPQSVNKLQLDKTAKGKVICFTEDFFSLRYNNNVLYQFEFLKQDSKPCIRLNNSQYQRFFELLKFMYDEFSAYQQTSNKVLRSYLNILLFQVDRAFSIVPHNYIKSIKKERVIEFETLVNKHFDLYKLPSEFADLMHLSANYLNKICKEETGKTAGEIIRKRIIIEAQRLLHYTNDSVNEISDKLGFENVSYFITMFKRETGFPPEKYRRIDSM
jgi:AraC family transcriptional activator of pobA